MLDAGWLHRRIGAQAVGPPLHGLAVDDATGVHVSQRLVREPVTLFLLGDPGRQRPLHDPAARSLEPVGYLIYLLGQRDGDVRTQNSGYRFCHRQLPQLNRHPK